MKIFGFIKKHWGKLLMFLILLSLFIFFLPSLIIGRFKNQIVSIEELEEHRVGIVFGAGVLKSGRPSDVLMDRLKIAEQLYKEGKIEKILVSGDNRVEHYNEPDVMKNYLVSFGIPQEDISEDFAGRRTFDTCIRANEIWGIEKAVLVSQEYHLYRAIFTCESLGIESVGVSATLQPYVLDEYYVSREKLAIYKAVIDLYLWEPDYVGGEAEEL